MKKLLLFVFEVVKISVITLAIVLPIRYYLVQPFFVKGASMDPNFADGQYLVINELVYRLAAPTRGDVIIFRYPADPSQYYIKRLIGLPNETIEISDGRIKIFNQEHPLGFVLDESNYLPNAITYGDNKITLKSGEFFVLGDNRQASFDSRRWGPVPAEDIIGRVWLRIWPFDQATVLSTPEY